MYGQRDIYNSPIARQDLFGLTNVKYSKKRIETLCTKIVSLVRAKAAAMGGAGSAYASDTIEDIKRWAGKISKHVNKIKAKDSSYAMTSDVSACYALGSGSIDFPQFLSRLGVVLPGADSGSGSGSGDDDYDETIDMSDIGGDASSIARSGWEDEYSMADFQSQGYTTPGGYVATGFPGYSNNAYYQPYATPLYSTPGSPTYNYYTTINRPGRGGSQPAQRGYTYSPTTHPMTRPGGTSTAMTRPAPSSSAMTRPVPTMLPGKGAALRRSYRGLNEAIYAGVAEGLGRKDLFGGLQRTDLFGNIQRSDLFGNIQRSDLFGSATGHDAEITTEAFEPLVGQDTMPRAGLFDDVDEQIDDLLEMDEENEGDEESVGFIGFATSPQERLALLEEKQKRIRAKEAALTASAQFVNERHPNWARRDLRQAARLDRRDDRIERRQGRIEDRMERRKAKELAAAGVDSYGISVFERDATRRLARLKREYDQARRAATPKSIERASKLKEEIDYLSTRIETARAMPEVGVQALQRGSGFENVPMRESMAPPKVDRKAAKPEDYLPQGSGDDEDDEDDDDDEVDVDISNEEASGVSDEEITEPIQLQKPPMSETRQERHGGLWRY